MRYTISYIDKIMLLYRKNEESIFLAHISENEFINWIDEKNLR